MPHESFLETNPFVDRYVYRKSPTSIFFYLILGVGSIDLPFLSPFFFNTPPCNGEAAPVAVACDASFYFLRMQHEVEQSPRSFLSFLRVLVVPS